MSEHTPGPWELAWEDGKHGVIGQTTGGKLVAIVGNNPDDGRNDERKANARLIAAAPDLLAACEAVLKWAETPQSEDRGTFTYFAEVIVPMVDVAIAKAKSGES